MQTLCGAVSKNKPGRPNEDAMMTALGDLVARVEKCGPEAARAQEMLRVRDQQGHLFAVLDGVGAAPRGRDVAQDIAETLRTPRAPWR